MTKLRLCATFVALTLCISCELMHAERSSNLSPKQHTSNLTQSLKIVKLSYNEYNHRVKTAPGPDAPMEARKFRDYVVTLRNDSDKDILVYRITLKGANAGAGENHFHQSFPIYDKEDFPPGAEATKHIYRAPADYVFEVNSVVFEGGRWEGEEKGATELLARLRASNAKLAAINQRIEAIPKLPDSRVRDEVQSLVDEIGQERSRLDAITKKGRINNVGEMYRVWGDLDGLSVARSHVAQIAKARNSESAKRIAADVAQRISKPLTKLQ